MYSHHFWWVLSWYLLAFRSHSVHVWTVLLTAYLLLYNCIQWAAVLKLSIHSFVLLLCHLTRLWIVVILLSHCTLAWSFYLVFQMDLHHCMLPALLVLKFSYNCRPCLPTQFFYDQYSFCFAYIKLLEHVFLPLVQCFFALHACLLHSSQM